MKKSLCYDMTIDEIRQANREQPIFTYQVEFEQALQKLGFFPGIQVVVHTALSSLGTFEGGATNFCRTLMAQITPQGTLLMPGLVKYPQDGESYVYDPLHTPCGVGKVPETFRQLPGVVRSLDPTHSFCAWGRDKLKFTRCHHQYPTMHAKSPLGQLEAADGYCLVVGCRHAVTFMHVVETSCHAPCLGARTEEYDAILPSGQRVKLRGWGWRRGVCLALRHDEIFDYMRKKATLNELMLGRCHLMLFKLKAYRDAYQRLLLAPSQGCAQCSTRPRIVQQTVISDWDEEHDCLKSDSTAFTGDNW